MGHGAAGGAGGSGMVQAPRWSECGGKARRWGRPLGTRPKAGLASGLLRMPWSTRPRGGFLWNRRRHLMVALRRAVRPSLVRRTRPLRR